MSDHCGCRAYAPIAELTGEHEQLVALAEPLADATRNHRRIDAAGRDRLIELLDRHVVKEEAGLYPLLIAEADWRSDALDQFEAEHGELFDAIDQGRFDHVAYYAPLRHIEEDEDELFSAALCHFDGDTWDDLDAAHRQVERSAPRLALPRPRDDPPPAYRARTGEAAAP
jgi:hemerythrin-like domain-containing protein